MPCKPLFPEVADIALKIFNELILVDVMDSPKMGDVTLPWVLDFVQAIFGAYDPVEKKRLIREFFLLISKVFFYSFSPIFRLFSNRFWAPESVFRRI